MAENSVETVAHPAIECRRRRCIEIQDGLDRSPEGGIKCRGGYVG